MAELQINQQFGQIGIDITPFQFDLKINQADLEVKQYPAVMDLEQPVITLEIDYSQFRESLGYCGIEAQMMSFVEKAKEACLQGIERRAVQGRQLSDLSKKVSIADIAKQAAMPNEKELQLVRLDPIKINFEINYPQGNVSVGGVKTSFTLGSIQSQFQYGKVDIYMEKEPYLDIKAVGASVDQSI